MTQEHEDAQPADGVTAEGQQALSALRGIWQAKSQTSADLDEACGNTKACTNMANVGFQGLADGEESPNKSDPSVGNNLRAAWKTKLEREGKLSTGTSVRDLVFGSADPDKK